MCTGKKNYRKILQFLAAKVNEYKVLYYACSGERGQKEYLSILITIFKILEEIKLKHI